MSVLRQDNVAVQPDRRALDPVALTGRWINTNTHGNGISEVAIEADRTGVRLQAFSATESTLCAWGATEAHLALASDKPAPTASAFAARYALNGLQTDLQAYLNLGLVVVTSLNSVGADGYDYFAREFYRRANPADAPRSVPWSEASGRVGGDDPVEPQRAAPGLPFDGSGMFGEWLNTNPVSRGIVRLRVDGDGNNRAILRAWGAQAPQPAEWRPCPARLFALSSGSRLAKAFSADYEADGVTVALQAVVKQGVLVVASFTEYNDGSGRPSYFNREFYYRD
jgi:hypothetical protein